MSRIILIALAFLSLSGCAQKLPPNMSNDVGLLAIPMIAVSDRGNRFFYYYKLNSADPNPAHITIQPSIGTHFAISAPLSAGDYVFDSFDLLANIQQDTMTPFQKESFSVSIPVEIESGQITVLNGILVVKNISVDSEEYQTYHGFRAFEEGEKAQFLEKLRAIENAENWQIKFSL
jgi:hypothetical protein